MTLRERQEREYVEEIVFNAAALLILNKKFRDVVREICEEFTPTEVEQLLRYYARA